MKKRYVWAALMMAFVLITPKVFAEEADDDTADSADDDADEAPAAKPETAPRDAWLGQMATALPNALCADKTYFRSCFTMTAAECATLATTLTKTYSTQFKSQIPANLTRAEAETWGGKLGEKVGTDFEKQSMAKRTNTPDCNNPDKWK